MPTRTVFVRGSIDAVIATLLEAIALVVIVVIVFLQTPSYLPQLKEDILKVISKYVAIDPNMVDLTFEHKDDDISVLELNAIKYPLPPCISTPSKPASIALIAACL